MNTEMINVASKIIILGVIVSMAESSCRQKFTYDICCIMTYIPVIGVGSTVSPISPVSLRMTFLYVVMGAYWVWAVYSVI